MGNTASYAIRRLRKDRPDLHRQVVKGKKSPHAEGKPFENLVEWLHYTFPNGTSMGEGKHTISYQDALTLTEGAPDVHRVLAENAPTQGHGGDRKSEEAKKNQASSKKLDRHGHPNSTAVLSARLAQEKPKFYERYMRSSVQSRDMPKREQSTRQIAARDKRKTAVHEAGHLTAYVALGIAARAFIWRENPKDFRTETFWGGQTVADCVGPTPAALVAGYVAEYWEREAGPIMLDAILADFENAFDELSESDKHGIPETRRDVKRVVGDAVKILQEHEPFFRWAIATLMKDLAITDGQAGEKFKEFRRRTRRNCGWDR